MRSPGEIWRQRVWVWVPALVFFLANATAYTIYQFGFADREAALKEDLKDTQDRLAPLLARKAKLAALIARGESNEREIQRLYAETFSTRKQRLTNITAEVKTLARKAGLDPKSLSYPQQEIQQYGLIKRSFIFSVEGTYLELRKFINLLELSNSFLTLEDMTLSEGSGEQAARGGGAGGGGGEGSELRINLTLSTLFAVDPNDPYAEVPPGTPSVSGGPGASAAPVARRSAS
jgi:Tfp pilus assembly protein PilO